MVTAAFFTQGGTWNAAALRQMIGAMYSYPAGSAPSTGGGVLTGLQVNQSGNAVYCQAGVAVIDDGTTGPGAYLGVQPTTTTTLAVTAVTSGSRTDTVYAYISDPGSGGTAGQMLFGVASGTTTLPVALSIPLARVTVKPGNVMTIVDVRPFAQPVSVPSDLNDTGWTNVQLGAAVSGSIQVRRVGKVVHLRGNVSLAHDSYGIAIVALQFAPSTNERFLYTGDGPTNPSRVDVQGVLTLTGGGIPMGWFDVYPDGNILAAITPGNPQLELSSLGHTNAYLSASWMVD